MRVLIPRMAKASIRVLDRLRASASGKPVLMNTRNFTIEYCFNEQIGYVFLVRVVDIDFTVQM